MTTNYERIKNMTVEEMAEFIKDTNYSFYDFSTTKLAIEWLQAEGEEQ